MLQKQREQIKVIKNKLINRETIVYGIAGVMTTVVNLISYYLFWEIIGIENLIANVIAWAIAVTFAYFINATWVFQEKKSTGKKEFVKIFKFYTARGFSLLFEEAGLFLFVEIMGLNNMPVKGALAVIVIIVNYFFSKLFIFNSSKKEGVTQE